MVSLPMVNPALGATKRAAMPPMGTHKAWEMMQYKQADAGGWCAPPDLVESNFLRARETFGLYDVNRDGHLDFVEFKKLMLANSPGKHNVDGISVLFHQVDREGLGAVSFPRFLCWLFCDNGRALPPSPQAQGRGGGGGGIVRSESTGGFGKKRRPSALGDAAMRRSSSSASLASPTSPTSPGSTMSTVSPGSGAGSPSFGLGRKNSSSALLPPMSPTGSRPSSPTAAEVMPHVSPITITIVYEEAYSAQVGVLMRGIGRNPYIKVVTRSDPRARIVESVIARIGNGIILWDRGTMVMHFENPFRSNSLSFAWCDDFMRNMLPFLVQVKALCAPADGE